MRIVPKNLINPTIQKIINTQSELRHSFAKVRIPGFLIIFSGSSTIFDSLNASSMTRCFRLARSSSLIPASVQLSGHPDAKQ
jgi:hypothetical protein